MKNQGDFVEQKVELLVTLQQTLEQHKLGKVSYYKARLVAKGY